MILFRLLLRAAPLLLFLLFSKIVRDMVYGAPSARRERDEAADSGKRRHGSERPPRRRDPFDVLGCSRSSSNEEIKKRYRELLGRYHPDKFIGQDLDEEFIALASRKFQEIQEAYGAIRTARGF